MFLLSKRGVVPSAVAAMLAAVHVYAAVPLDFAVDLQATISTSAPHVVLTWTQRLQSSIASQKLYRRLKGEPAWALQATLTNTQTSYTDTTALPGIEYEYWMERTFTGLSPTRAIGFLSAGVNIPLVENRGTVVLLVDNSMVGPLAPEIAQLQQDLVSDGWKVIRHDVPRMQVSPSDTNAANWTARRAELDACRNLVRTAYNGDPSNVKAVYLLGRVPVPYSGYIAPDGHSDHAGAWPADVYFGELDTTWTDTTVDRTTASGTRNDNVPGDGKFDQNLVPGTVKLQVGRVDLSNMSKFPSSGASEIVLLRRYLRKVHDYRYKQGAYANVPRRSLIRDGFGHAFSSEPFAVAGWATAFSCVGKAPGAPIDQAGSGQWFTTAAANTYLWGHGNGAGSHESASTVGTSTDFGRKASRVVFTSLFGSYHGDWDQSNTFLRAPLAGTATGDSLGLVCFWTGRPHWFLHPCGMGETIGYAARLTQNNNGTEYAPSVVAARGVHVALMGDPTLRFHMVEPPRGFAATSAPGQVALKWRASNEAGILGYHVYRADTELGPFTRLTSSPLSAPGFVDSTVAPGQSYTYMARTLKLESVPGGTYQNLSQGAVLTITANGSTGMPFNPSELVATSMSANQTVLAWNDNSDDESGFRIERKTNAAGTFASIGSVDANVTTFTDAAAQSNGNVYYYRVSALGVGGDSRPSHETAVDGVTGFYDLSNARQKVSRSTGTVALTVNRFGGRTGAASVNAATSDTSAIAGTHYTAFNGVVQFGDGEEGSKIVNIPLLNSSQPQLPRQFKFTLSSPNAGGSLGQQTLTRVLIEDPSATLPSGWQQAILGSVTDSSPAVFAENAFGSALIGGTLNTAENGRFIYRSRTGDGVITAFIDAPLPAQNAAIFGVIVRGTTSSNGAMAAVTVEGDSGGTNLASRITSGQDRTLTPGDSNNLKAPRWVRLTRAGDIFTAEHSSDGIAWTVLGSKEVPVAANALWGLYHVADGSSDFQLARFRYVTITNLGAIATPANLRAAAELPGQSRVTWDPVGGAGGYRVERRALHGAFTPLQTLDPGITSLNDATILAGVIYEYRVQAYSGTNSSGWSSLVTFTAPGNPSNYTQWLQANSLPMDGTADGAPVASPAGDGITNAMKHALGLNPRQAGYAGRLSTGASEVSGQRYLTLTYSRPEPAPAGVSYEVQTSGSVAGPWSTVQTIEMNNAVNAGLRTITVRDTQPVSEVLGQRFIRLSARVP